MGGAGLRCSVDPAIRMVPVLSPRASPLHQCPRKRSRVAVRRQARDMARLSLACIGFAFLVEHGTAGDRECRRVRPGRFCPGPGPPAGTARGADNAWSLRPGGAKPVFLARAFLGLDPAMPAGPALFAIVSVGRALALRLCRQHVREYAQHLHQSHHPLSGVEHALSCGASHPSAGSVSQTAGTARPDGWAPRRDVGRLRGFHGRVCSRHRQAARTRLGAVAATKDGSPVANLQGLARSRDLAVGRADQEWRFGLEMFFDHRDRVVEPDALDLSGHFVKGKDVVLIGVPAVHLVDQPLGIFDKALLFAVAAAETGPVAGMRVLDDVSAAVVQVRPEMFETGDLLMHMVAAVIHDDVERAVLFGQHGQEIRIGLIADFHIGARFRVPGAIGVDIDKAQARLLAEIPGPHRDGATPVDADFGKEARLTFVDIDPDCARHAEPGTNVEIGDQADPDFLAMLAEKHGPFDIILDDGGHHVHQQITSFEHLWPHLNDRGRYIVEDTHTSYWPGFGGGYREEKSFIEYAKRLIDKMHSWYTDQDDIFPFHEMARQVEGIRFYDSVTVIEKHLKAEPPLLIGSTNGKVTGSRKSLQVRDRRSVFRGRDGT